MSTKKSTLPKELPKNSELDDFNPDQFDRNFDSSSSREELPPPPPKPKDYHNEDKILLDQLGAISNLMKRIDAQLANKDRLLNSTTTTPSRPNKSSVLQFAPDEKPKNTTPAQSKAELDKRKSALMVPLEPIKGRERRRTSRSDIDGFKPPMPPQRTTSNYDQFDDKPIYDSYRDPEDDDHPPGKLDDNKRSKYPEDDYTKGPFQNPKSSRNAPERKERESDPRIGRQLPDDNEARRKLRQQEDNEDDGYKGPLRDRAKDFYTPRNPENENPKDKSKDKAARKKDRRDELDEIPEYSEEQRDEKLSNPKKRDPKSKDYGIDEFDPKNVLRDYTKEDDYERPNEKRSSQRNDDPDDYALPEFKKYDQKKNRPDNKNNFSDKVLSSPAQVIKTKPQQSQKPDEFDNNASYSKRDGPSENMDTTKGYQTGSFDDGTRKNPPKGPISPDRDEDRSKKRDYREDSNRNPNKYEEEDDDPRYNNKSDLSRHNKNDHNDSREFEEDKDKYDDPKDSKKKSENKWRDPYDDWEREPDPTADGRSSNRPEKGSNIKKQDTINRSNKPIENIEENRVDERATYKQSPRDPDRAHPPGNYEEYRDEEKINRHKSNINDDNRTNNKDTRNPQKSQPDQTSKKDNKIYRDFTESDHNDTDQLQNIDSDKDEKFYPIPKEAPANEERISKHESYSKVHHSNNLENQRNRDSNKDIKPNKHVDGTEDYRNQKTTREDQYYYENNSKKYQNNSKPIDPQEDDRNSAKGKTKVDSNEEVIQFSLKIPEKPTKNKGGSGTEKRPEDQDKPSEKSNISSSTVVDIKQSQRPPQNMEETINIPNVTYPKIKHFMSKYKELDLDDPEKLQEKLNDKNTTPEEKAERREALKELLNLGGNIVVDLDKANHNNRYVDNLKKDFNNLENDKEAIISENDERKREEFEDFSEKIGNLIVEEKSFTNNEEKSKFKELARRKSVTRIYNENEMGNKDLTKDELKDAIIHFLKDYATRVKSLKTPTSQDMANEAENTIEFINKIDKKRSPEETTDMLNLINYDIKKNFKVEDLEKKISSSNDKSPSEKKVDNNSLDDNNLVEFDHLLRGLNNYGDTKFSTLDPLITDPSNMVNLWVLRNNLATEGKIDASKDKENDLIKLNNISKDYPTMDKLIINLSKDLSPPRCYEEAKAQGADKSIAIQFIDTNRKQSDNEMRDSFDFGKFHSFKNQVGESNTLQEPVKKVFIDPMQAQSTIGGQESGRDSNKNKSNEMNFISPNVINSDDEMISPPVIQQQGSQNEFHKPEDYKDLRQDVADELEYLIEQMVQERVDVDNYKRLIRDDVHNKDNIGKVSHEHVERLHDHLQNCNNFENSGKPAEPIFIELRENATPGDWRKGVLYSFPRFEKELSRLKKAISDMMKELQRNLSKKLEEADTKEKELEKVVEQAEDEANEEKEWIEEQGKKSDPAQIEKLEEFKEEIGNLKEVLQKKRDQKDEMEKLKEELKKAQTALEPTEVEKTTNKDKPSVVIVPAARRLSKVDLGLKNKEELEKLKELEGTVKNLNDIIEELKKKQEDQENLIRKRIPSQDRKDNIREKRKSNHAINQIPAQGEVSERLRQSIIEPKKPIQQSIFDQKASQIPQHPNDPFVSKVMDKYGVGPAEENRDLQIEEEIANYKKQLNIEGDTHRSKIGDNKLKKDPIGLSLVEDLKQLAYSLLDSINRAENAAAAAYESTSSQKEVEKRAVEAQDQYEPTREQLIENLESSETKEKLAEIQKDKIGISKIEMSIGPDEAKQVESLPQIAKDLKQVCEQTENINQDPERREHMKEKTHDLIQALENIEKATLIEDGKDKFDSHKTESAIGLVPINPEEDLRLAEEIQLERTKRKLKHTLEQLRALAHAILSSIQSAKELDEKRATISPMDRKYEEETVQGQYEFSRNGLLSTLAEPETNLLLQQRDHLPELADDVKDSCGNIVKFTKEPQNREDLKIKTQEFYDALKPIKLDNIEEIKKIQDLEEGVKEEAKIKEEAAKRKEERTLQDKEKTLEEVIKDLKEATDELQKSVAHPESKVSPSYQQQIEEKADRVNDLLTNVDTIPKVAAVSEANELVETHIQATGKKDDPKTEKIQENAEKLNDIILAINTVEMEKAAKELLKTAEEQKVDLQKKPDDALEERENKPLKASEKDQLKEKLDQLKQAVQEGADCAEKTMEIKASAIEKTVNNQQQEPGENRNEMKNRMKDKTKEIKQAVESGDPNNTIPHIINDIEVANERDIENKAKEGKPIDPEEQQKTIEAIDKIKKANNGYNNIKKRIKSDYLPLIKAVEAILANQEAKKQTQPIPLGPEQSIVLNNSIPHTGSGRDTGRIESSRMRNLPQEPIPIEKHQEEEDSEVGNHEKDEDNNMGKDLKNFEDKPEESGVRKSKNKEINDKLEQESKESKKGYNHEVFTEESGDVNPADFDSLREKQKNKRREEKPREDKLKDPEADFKKKQPEVITPNSDDEDARRRAEEEAARRRAADEDARRRAEEEARRRAEEEARRRAEEEEARRRAEEEEARKLEAEEVERKNERLRQIELEDEARRKAETKEPPKQPDTKKRDSEELTPPRPSVPPYDHDRSGESKPDDRGKSDEKPRVPPPIVRPPPPEKKMRTYYKPSNTVVDTKPPSTLPILKPVRYLETTDSSASPKLSPSSSVESFYVEKKKEGETVYSRKARELKPNEKKARKDKIEQEKKMENTPGVIIGEKLHPSTEWNRGKRVFLKEKEFVVIKPKEENKYIEKKIDYFDVVDINPDTEERIVVQEEGKLRTTIETEEQKKRGQDEEPKFVVMKGDDGEYKVIKLNNLDNNPLVPNEKDSKSKLSKPVEVFEKTPLTFHDLPILNIVTLSPTKNKTMNPDELNNFMKQVQAQPGGAVSLWEQTNDTLDGKPVIEGRTNIGGKGMEKAAKTIDAMGDEGKLNNVDPIKKKKDQDMKMKEEMARITKSDNFSMRTFKGPKFDPKLTLPIKEVAIEATPIIIEGEDGEKAKTGYQLNENKNKGLDTDTTMAENEPIEELKRILPNIKPISDVQPIYSDLSKQCLNITPNTKEQAEMLDELFKEVDDEVKKRGIPFDDGMFIAGPSSMVNNSIKSSHPYKSQPWEKLSDQYEFPIFLSNFNPTEIFPKIDPTPKFAACLAALCEHPQRIKQLFSSHEISREGLYGVKLYPNGRLESIIVDDKIPWSENKDEGPFYLKPDNLPECIKNPNKKRKRHIDYEADIWPQILIKAHAKALGCFERLMAQKIEDTLADLTGMGIKIYSTSPAELPFNWLRESYKRGYIVIAKATSKWTSQLKGEIEADSDTYWTVSQVVQINDEEQLIEVKNHCCPNQQPPDWRTDQILKIGEDWMKHRRYKKRDKQGYWVPFTEFSEMFESVIVCRYRDDYHSLWKSVESKNDGPFSCTLVTEQLTQVNISLVQQDVVCCSASHTYTVFRTFLLHYPEAEKGSPEPQPEIVKAAYNNPAKSVSIETRLESGKFKLLVDVECPNRDFGQYISIAIHSDKPIKLTVDSTPDSFRLHKDTLSKLAIQRGERTDLVGEGTLRRFSLPSPKLGMYLLAYANRSNHFYNSVERLSEFKAKCNKELDEGNLLSLQFPPNSRKILIFRHKPDQDPQVSITESSYKQKK